MVWFCPSVTKSTFNFFFSILLRHSKITISLISYLTTKFFVKYFTFRVQECGNFFNIREIWLAHPSRKKRGMKKRQFLNLISRAWQINVSADFNLTNRFSSRNALAVQGLSYKNFHYIPENVLAFLKTIQCWGFKNSNFEFRMFDYFCFVWSFSHLSSSCLT